jgi:hypothetical protein
MFSIQLNEPLLTRFELERAVAASINAGLSEVVGEKCRDAIVKLFLKNSGLKRLEDVVDCPERFEKFMGNVFGKGSVLLMDRIVQNLMQRTSSTGSGCFSEQVTRLKELCLV